MLLQSGDDLEQARPAAAAHVVRLARDGSRGCRRRQEIGGDHVVDVGEVSRLRPVAVDLERLALDRPEDEARDHRCILTLRILSRSEDVEIAQPHRLYIEETAPYRAVEFTRHLAR